MESFKRKRASDEDTRESPSKYVRMQDVVKLSFPLTLLWRSNKYTAKDAIATGDSAYKVRKSHSKPQRTVVTMACDDRTTPQYTSARNPSVPRFGKPPDKAQNTRSSYCPPKFESTTSTQPATKSKSSTPVAQSVPISVTPITTPRQHKIKSRNFESGTAPIPQEIQDLHAAIRNCPCHNKSGLPVRSALRKQAAEHFAGVTGYLKAASPLNTWLGDTRLFTREEWYYLKGWSREEGRKGGGGEVHAAEKAVGGDSDANG